MKLSNSNNKNCQISIKNSTGFNIYGFLAIAVLRATRPMPKPRKLADSDSAESYWTLLAGRTQMTSLARTSSLIALSPLGASLPWRGPAARRTLRPAWQLSSSHWYSCPLPTAEDVLLDCPAHHRLPSILFSSFLHANPREFTAGWHGHLAATSVRLTPRFQSNKKLK